MTKRKPKSRVGHHFVGYVDGQYFEHWIILEYLGGGWFLVAKDQGHTKSCYIKTRL